MIKQRGIFQVVKHPLDKQDALGPLQQKYMTSQRTQVINAGLKWQPGSILDFKEPLFIYTG